MLYLVFGINKPLPWRVILADSPPQKDEFLLSNWPTAPAEARVDRDRVTIYLPLPPSTWCQEVGMRGSTKAMPNREAAKAIYAVSFGLLPQDIDFYVRSSL
jgi:hypothetical protein